jgi:hypothetical protein
MRCCCCNRNLSDYESTLRHPDTLAFLDICKKCLPDTGIKAVEGATKEENTDYDDDVEQEIWEPDLDFGEEEDE